MRPLLALAYICKVQLKNYPLPVYRNRLSVDYMVNFSGRISHLFFLIIFLLDPTETLEEKLEKMKKMYNYNFYNRVKMYVNCKIL